MKRLRGAVIGCGLIAEFHLRGWQRVPEVEIVALADPDVARAEDRRTQFAPEAKIYRDLVDVLAAEKLDFIDVLSPPALHAAHCRAARAAGLHVVCQKPLCDELAVARDLVAEFAGGRQLLCVHENHRYRPWFREIAARHRDGFFGPLRRVRLEQNDPTEPPQRLNSEAPRGVLLQYGIHLVDQVRQLLGVPVKISARLHRVNPAVRGESLAQVTFTYPGCTATVEVAYKNGVIAQGSALILGDTGEGYFEGPMTRGGATRFRLSQGRALVRDEARSSVEDYIESFFAFEREFAHAVLYGAPAPQPAGENLQTLAMTFAAYDAADSDRPVDCAEFFAHHHLKIPPA